MRATLRVALLALPIFLLALHPIDSADVWFHLATGELIGRTHALPTVDPFTAVPPPHPWIVHDWLAAVVLHSLYRLGGATALVWVAALLFTLALVLPLWRAARAGRQTWPYEIALLLSGCIAYERFFVRPEMFSVVLAAVWVQVLSRGGPRSSRGFAALVASQIAWANLHGAFLLGPALAMLALAGDAMDRLLLSPEPRARPSRARRALPIAALLACCVNPYGPKLVMHILGAARALGGSGLRAGIVEWQPTFASPVPGDLVLMTFVVSLVFLASGALAGRRTLGGFDLLAVVALTALGLSSRRQLVFYAAIVLPLAAGWHAAAMPRARRTAGAAKFTLRALVVRAVSLVPPALAVWLALDVARGGFYASAGPPRSLGWGFSAADHPIGAGEFVARHRLEGPLFNNVAAGSYLLWRLRGDPPVLVDGRLLDPEQFRLYRRCLESNAEFDALASRRGMRVVVLALQPFPPVQLFRHLYAAPDWRLVFLDGEGAVFARAEVAAQRHLAPVQLDAPLATQSAPVGAGRGWRRVCDPGEAYRRGYLLLGLGFPRAASADLSRALLHCTERWDIGLALSSALVGSGRASEALPLVDRALREDPANPDAWVNLGLCQVASGDTTRALAAWERAAALGPSDPRPARLRRALGR